ncbi:MAG: transglycosylase SLT domain-containing protein [Methylophilaceae bacterium]
MAQFSGSHFIVSFVFLAFTAINGAVAASGDDEFLRARAAYDKRNAIALTEYVQQLQHQQYILAPYADYWLMLLNLEEADHQTVADFLNTYSEYPFADRLRGEYLKKLAKQQDWEAFSNEYANYRSEDAAVACYAAEAAANGDAALLESAQSLWLQAKELPSNCNRLYDRMQAANVLGEDDIWARFRLALADNRLSLAKAIAKRSKTFEAIQYKLIDSASASPALVLNKKSISFKSRFGREVNLFALSRLAKTSSSQALAAFKKVEGLFQAEDSSYFYGRLAMQAAQRHEPESLQWFSKAENTDLSKDQLAWFVRAALRQKNWPVVLEVIAKMDASQTEEAPWRYWKARALQVQQQTFEANGLLARLSTERHYYGWLAQEELDGFISSPPVYYKVTNDEVDEVALTPAIQRTEALQRMDLRWEAKLEWAFATKDFSDQQLLAAAEFASRKQWHDLAIITADKTTEMHDFALRYPTPYRDLMRPAASEQDIDEAWVYGITRQESRFMHYAKSSAGASGLMQLMPATAKWAAPRAGIDNYNNTMIQELDTNIALGTYYLSHTLALMNGQTAMATAAYNAGPSRAKKWAAEIPLEGAIYAETIPFSETRTYVQKVMANAHLYAQRLGLKTMTLKQRLGIVPGKSEAVNIAKEENTWVEPDQPNE